MNIALVNDICYILPSARRRLFYPIPTQRGDSAICILIRHKWSAAVFLDRTRFASRWKHGTCMSLRVVPNIFSAWLSVNVAAPVGKISPYCISDPMRFQQSHVPQVLLPTGLCGTPYGGLSYGSSTAHVGIHVQDIHGYAVHAAWWSTMSPPFKCICHGTFSEDHSAPTSTILLAGVDG